MVYFSFLYHYLNVPSLISDFIYFSLLFLSPAKACQFIHLGKKKKKKKKKKILG